MDHRSLLKATIVSTLWIVVDIDLKRTSSELLINAGPDSPHVSGTSRSLSVYTSMSNAPESYGNIVGRGANKSTKCEAACSEAIENETSSALCFQSYCTRRCVCNGRPGLHGHIALISSFPMVVLD